MDAVRVGIVGLGTIAQVVYLPLLARRRDMFRVTAVCDADHDHAVTFGAELAVPAYGDPQVMLDAGGFDAVVLLTAGPHGPLARAALARRYWVLCETPLAYSQAEVADLPGADRLMVAHMRQYDPATQRMLACLHEVGGAPAVRHLDVVVLRPSEESQLLFARVRSPHPAPERLGGCRETEDRSLSDALGTRSSWLRRLYARAVLGGAGQELSLVRLLTGPPTGIDHVAAWPREAFPPSLEVSASLPYGRCRLAWHHLPGYPAYHGTVAVHHEHGSLELRFPSPYLLNAPTRLTVRSRVGTTERTTVYQDIAEAFERQLVAFYRFVTQDEPPLTRLDGALADIITAQRIVRHQAEAAGIPIGGECVERPARDVAS